jgi:hypothetical protein
MVFCLDHCAYLNKAVQLEDDKSNKELHKYLNINKFESGESIQTRGRSRSTSSSQFNASQHPDLALRKIAERVVSTMRLIGYY